jgi:ribonuclease E
VAEPAPVVVAEPAPEPQTVDRTVEEPVVEAPTIDPPVAPEPPKVVTRTRGRAATRPAGPPVETAAGGSGDVVGAVGVDGEQVDGEHPHVEHVPIKKKGSRKR